MATASECFRALSMSLHPRLGAASPARHLSTELVERIADFLTPRLDEMELFVTYHQVHKQIDLHTNPIYVTSRSRSFELRASLFLLPHLGRKCKNVQCGTVPGAQCTCRRVQRAFEDLKFKVELQDDAGNSLPASAEDNAPALSAERKPSHPPYATSQDSTLQQSCGRFIVKTARSSPQDYEVAWILKIREDVALNRNYKVLISPADDQIRINYPKLSANTFSFVLRG